MEVVLELTEQTVRISCRRHRRKYYTVWLEHRQQFILENYLRVKHLRKKRKHCAVAISCIHTEWCGLSIHDKQMYAFVKLSTFLNVVFFNFKRLALLERFVSIRKSYMYVLQYTTNIYFY